MSRKDRRHDPETAERVTSIIEAAEQAAAALFDKAEANAGRYLAAAKAEADQVAAARLQELLETADALQAQAEAVRREAARLLESLRHAQLGPQVQNGSQPAAAGQHPAATEPHEAGPVAPADGAGPRAKHLAAVPGPSPSAVQAPRPVSDPDPVGSGQDDFLSSEPGPMAPTPTAAGPSVGEPHRSEGAAGARLLATQMAVSGYGRREIEAKLREGFQIEDPTAILDAILGPGD
ncbi:MAG: hypothetical protein ABW065_03340 [Solirubrobacterales bacterium]